MSADLVQILLNATKETLYMLLLTSLFAMILGIPLGVLLMVTDKDGISSFPKLNKVLGICINTVRSMPEVILIIVLLPLSRLVVGTTLGANAAIVAMSIGCAPMIARIIESSLKEVGHGKIEAAEVMGATPLQIIVKVLLPEALPSIIRGLTIAIIGVLGFTAIAGTIGAGGLGSLAIRFGYQRFQTDILVSTVCILLVLVQLLQITGDTVARCINKKRYKSE
ncbi:MAG: methionine ABC transporter permease [Lachnospiraceae bacterium]